MPFFTIRMKIPQKVKTIGSFIIVGLIIVLFFVPNSKIKPIEMTEFNHPLSIGEVSLNVAFAPLPPEQELGLSGTKSLGADQGMLFLFPSAINQSFWMKDMNYPIDIIWLGADKTVVDVSKNVDPKSYPKTFSPKVPAQYVLEVNAGFSDLNNVTEGTIVTF